MCFAWSWAIPGLFWDIYPSSSARAPVVGLVCGDLDALWVRGAHGVSPPVFSLVLYPHEMTRMSEIHPHVSRQGEHSMTDTPPKPLTPRTAGPCITSGSAVAEASWVPGLFRPRRDPMLLYLVGASTAYCTVSAIGWVRCSTRLMRPTFGAPGTLT